MSKYRARVLGWLDSEEACGWNSYREGDHQMEHTLLRPRADVSLAAEFEAIRSETIKECAAACLVQIKRDSGYHGQWEGYGPWMGDMTGTECSAVILALDKR